MCIIVGYIEISVLAKFGSPTVLTDKSTIFLRRLVKVVLAVIVIPSDYYHIVVDSL